MIHSIADMTVYVQSRSTEELQQEFATYRPMYTQGRFDVFVELLAIELDHRIKNDDE